MQKDKNNKNKIMKTTNNMKKLILSAAFLAASFATVAQVGVGTTMPSAALDVVSTGSGTDKAVEINSALGELITILDNGKVGIGIAAPTTALHVVGDGSIKIEGDHASVVLFDNNSTDNSSFNWQNTSFVGAQRLRLNYDDDNTSLGDIMTILPDGKVGIGIAAPTSKLQVVGLPVHADNAAALAASPPLTAGAFYHNGDGIVRVVF